MVLAESFWNDWTEHRGTVVVSAEREVLLGVVVVDGELGICIFETIPQFLNLSKVE